MALPVYAWTVQYWLYENWRAHGHRTTLHAPPVGIATTVMVNAEALDRRTARGMGPSRPWPLPSRRPRPGADLLGAAAFADLERRPLARIREQRPVVATLRVLDRRVHGDRAARARSPRAMARGRASMHGRTDAWPGRARRVSDLLGPRPRRRVVHPLVHPRHEIRWSWRWLNGTTTGAEQVKHDARGLDAQSGADS